MAATIEDLAKQIKTLQDQNEKEQKTMSDEMSGLLTKSREETKQVFLTYDQKVSKIEEQKNALQQTCNDSCKQVDELEKSMKLSNEKITKLEEQNRALEQARLDAVSKL